MMNSKKSILWHLGLTATVLFFLTLAVQARPKDNRVSKSLNKAAAVQSTRTILNIGNWTYWMQWDGQSGGDPITGNSGGLYPRGTVSTIFADGFLWGGIVDDPANAFPVRVGGSTYISGAVPGYIGDDGRRVDPTQDTRIRIYRIRADWESLTPSLVTRDAAEQNGIAEGAVTEAQQLAILDQYEADWNEWPVELGAPFNDLNGNGVYEPELDETPGIANADQVVWAVMNDLDASAVNDFSGAPSMGLEYQTVGWGYNQPNAALGQIIFKKYVFINQSQFRIDSMYACQWSDPDLGSYGDDVTGNDSLLSLGFIYNGGAADATYNGIGRPPASAGYDFFQGPLVAGEAGEDLNLNGIDDATDTGIFNLQRTEPGFINLPMTSFGFFAAGDPVISDPPLGEYDGTRGWYNLLRGFIPTFDMENPTPFTHRDGALSGRVTKFPLNGDPFEAIVNNNAALDIDARGGNLSPGDRRLLLATGPFIMQPGDVQEIVVALMGGEGSADPNDPIAYLKAVNVVKSTDQVAQQLFDDLFTTVPKPPEQPKTTGIPFSDHIVLEWGSDAAAIAATERDNPSTGYNFEGYNVYQLPAANSTLNEGVRIATFDEVNGVTTIKGKRLLNETGTVEVVTVQFGSDNGIQRYFTVDRNFLTGGELWPGNEYYFAVTAYNYNDFSVVAPLIEDSTLESGATILTVVPQDPNPGQRYPDSGSQVEVDLSQNNSDGQVSVEIIDPTATIDAGYEVFFTEFEDTVNHTTEILWNVRRGGEVIVADQRQASSLDERNDQPIVSGIQVKVSGPPPGVNPGGEGEGWDIPAGTRRFTWANANFGWEGFNGAIGWGSPAGANGFGTFATEAIPPDQLKPVLLQLATVDTLGNFDRNDPNVSYGYRYLRNANQPPALPEFAPYILNPGASYDFQIFEKNIPLSAWDISDPDNPRRLVVGFLENNVAGGLVDGIYFPGDNNVYENTGAGGPREWLFIFDADYSETVDPNLSINSINNLLPIMFWSTANRRGNVPFSPGGSGEDQFTIIPTRPITVNDLFTFTTTAPVRNDQAMARQDVEKINVFPNPYYAYNPSEQNRFNRFVTFNHLPEKATIRIFNLAGIQVRQIEKNSQAQFLRWNLQNENSLPVASGIYIVHIDMPDLGKEKVLKVYIIQSEEILQFF